MIINGKVLIIDGEACRIYSKGYKVYDQHKVKGVVLDSKYALFSRFPFIRRLLRAEITGAYYLHNGRILLLAKKGIFIDLLKDGNFQKVFVISRGSKPLNICILPNGHIFWGEYFQNRDRKAVNIYGSTDNGLTWGVVYTFPKGNINHIHGLFYDPYTQWIWILTGDREDECRICYTSDEFKTIQSILKGGQEYRSCQLFFYKDFIVYATDSQYMENRICKIDRKTFEVTIITKIQGSAIKGGQVANISYFSTTVEPSEINKDCYSHIWLTKDGQNWEDVMKAEKDCWPAIFQFGTFEFPQNAYVNGKLWFSGRALKRFDNKSSYIEI